METPEIKLVPSAPFLKYSGKLVNALLKQKQSSYKNLYESDCKIHIIVEDGVLFCDEFKDFLIGGTYEVTRINTKYLSLRFKKRNYTRVLVNKHITYTIEPIIEA